MDEENNHHVAKTSISGRSLPGRTRPKPVNVVGRCPVCGGEVVERPDRYNCRSNKEDCNFSIRRNRLAGLGKKDIAPREISFLLEDKILPMRRLWTREGERFEAGGELCWDEKWGWSVQLTHIAYADPLPRVPSLLAKHPRLNKTKE